MALKMESLVSFWETFYFNGLMVSCSFFPLWCFYTDFQRSQYLGTLPARLTDLWQDSTVGPWDAGYPGGEVAHPQKWSYWVQKAGRVEKSTAESPRAGASPPCRFNVSEKGKHSLTRHQPVCPRDGGIRTDLIHLLHQQILLLKRQTSSPPLHPQTTAA